MTCKDCLYYPKCYSVISYSMDIDDITGELTTDMDQKCKDFKEKSLIVELQCKPGDIVYVLYPRIKYIEKYRVVGIKLGEKHDTIQFRGGSVFTIWDKKYNEFFGKTIFLNPEEAEKARMELKQ